MSGGAGAHTPEPWIAETGVGRGAWICGVNDEWSALACGDTDKSADANATRIVACVNALAGIPTDQLEGLMDEVRGVLAPFAETAANDIGEDETDGDTFRPMSPRFNKVPLITVGDLRRAAALLSKLGKQP